MLQFWGLEDITVDQSYWTNACYAHYFNLASVRSTSKDRWDNIYQNGNSKLMNIYSTEEYFTEIPNINDIKIIAINNGITNDDKINSYLSNLQIINKDMNEITEIDGFKVNVNNDNIAITKDGFQYNTSSQNYQILVLDKNNNVLDYIEISPDKDSEIIRV